LRETGYTQTAIDALGAQGAVGIGNLQAGNDEFIAADGHTPGKGSE
jgi:hypothetical protein